MRKTKSNLKNVICSCGALMIGLLNMSSTDSWPSQKKMPSRLLVPAKTAGVQREPQTAPLMAPVSVVKKYADPFPLSPGDEIVAEEKTQEDAFGNFYKIIIVRTDFKYPLIRLEEKLNRSPTSVPGVIEEKLVRSDRMVADHVLVSAPSEQNETAFARSLADTGARVLMVMPLSGLFLIEFDGLKISEMKKILQGVQGSEPDFIVKSL